MPEEAAIQFYEITRCGYYEDYSSEREFGDLEGTLSTLQEWTRRDNMQLRRTKIFEPEEGSSIRPTYCYDIQHDENSENYLLTTWNQTPTSEGQYASVEAEAPVGEADVTLTDVPQGNIPGYATYFWFVPEDAILATVQFQHRIANGKPGLEEYLNTFLARHHSEHVHLAQNGEAELEVEGYQRRPGADVRDDLNGRFRTRAIRPPGPVDHIRANRPGIYKVIRKSELDGETIANTPVSFYQALLSKLGINEGDQPADPVRSRYEVNFTPTEGQLDNLIENWQQDGGNDAWDDIGFKMSGDSRTYWLSHSVGRYEEELDVDRVNDEIIGGESLLSELDDMEDDLLERLPDEED
jgi:hypothetical protein